MDQVEVNVGIDTVAKPNIIDSKCLERVGSIFIHWETRFSNNNINKKNTQNQSTQNQSSIFFIFRGRDLATAGSQYQKKKFVDSCFEVEPTLKIVDRTEEFLFISKIRPEPY